MLCFKNSSFSLDSQMFGFSWTEKSAGWIPQQLWCLFQILGFGNLRQFIWNSSIVCCFFPCTDEQKIPPNRGGVLNAFRFNVSIFEWRNFWGKTCWPPGGYRPGRGVGTIGQWMDTNLVGAEGGAYGRSTAFLIYYPLFWGVSGGVGEVAKYLNTSPKFRNI